MNITEQKKNAKEFAERWKDKGYEKGESQKYWIDLLQRVYGIGDALSFIEFEDAVHIDKTNGFIDAYIPETKVLIEQKSIDKDLKKAIKQSDGSLLNPFQQAKKYIAELPLSKHPKWVVTCNFKSFLVYDMENPNGEPEEILLKNLQKEYYRLQFLVDIKSDHIKKEEELSFKAGDLVGKLYDAFSKQYVDIKKEASQKSLNELCVRLVFCLYSEDAGLFGRKNVFHDYLAKSNDLVDMRNRLITLFKILDTKLEDRDPYLDDDLNQFPYVNGGLFSNENIEIPKFTDEIKNTLLSKASDDFDWSEISPTIFGAVFESTLNPETRRSGGMHYTSIENIHKVIDPLFLDELRKELNGALAYKQDKNREEKLLTFQNHLASLKFLDPACGSGNFLTETYLALRRLENEALEAINSINANMVMLDTSSKNISIIKVSIQQFYGIEINDFAVKVAKTALWIAESQTWLETQKVLNNNKNLGDFLPLETYENIKEGNALRMDWFSVIDNTKCNYIVGNPPFHGFTYMTKEQKDDMKLLFPGTNNLDYVCGWYKKASDFIRNTNIEVAFVSTNSIIQGETVSRFWEYMKGDVINFAYKNFLWDSEANAKAHVYCVIIGFAKHQRNNKFLFDNGTYKIVKNINYYLLDGENVLLKSRNAPICNVPKMIYGNKPADGGFLIIEDNELDDFVKKDPNSQKYIHPLLGASEYIKGNKRWCLWMVDASPSELKKCPEVLKRIEGCKKTRENSIAAGIRKFASTPTLFAQRTQPTGKDFIIVPRVSGESRKYIPIGFIKAGTIVTDAVQIIPDANLYEFGVLTSSVHMSWMRVVAGRLGMSYRYSKDIVYNNFPWPHPTDEQKFEIEKTAQAILDARNKYPNCSFADLYDELTMPAELRTAHQRNDVAVMKAYGFDWKTMTESDCVSELMKKYQNIVKSL